MYANEYYMLEFQMANKSTAVGEKGMWHENDSENSMLSNVYK